MNSTGASSTHRAPIKDVNSDSLIRNRTRRHRMSEELRKDARARLVSAKRARPNPHQLTGELISIDQCMSAIGQLEHRLMALKTLRHLLESHPTPAVIPKLSEIISSDTAEPDVADEAIWCLNVLAHGYDALSVIEIAPLLLHRLSERLPGMKAAAWTLANLAADNPGNRHRLRALGSIDIMLTVLENAKSIEMSRIAAWALCNLVRGHNPSEELRPIIESRLPSSLTNLASQAINEGRMQVLAELLWIFTYLTAGDSKHSEYLLELGLGSVLYRSLSLPVNGDNERAVKDSLLAALRCIGNIVSGPDQLSDALLTQPDFLKHLGECLNDPNPAIIKEAMWAISNISGGSPNHALAVLSCNLLPKIVSLFRSGTFDIKKECGFALYNLARIELLFDRIWNCQVLDVFLSLMRVQDGEAAELGFKFVKLALKQVPGNDAIQALKDNDGQAVLEDLRLVREDLQPEANALIDQYLDPFDDDYNGDINDVQPADISSYPPWRVGAHQN